MKKTIFALIAFLIGSHVIFQFWALTPSGRDFLRETLVVAQLKKGDSEATGGYIRDLAFVIKALDHRNHTVRETAEKVLLEKVSIRSLPMLIANIYDKDPRVRYWIAKRIGAFGPDAYSAVAHLEVLLYDEDLEVREVAQRSLELIKGT